MSTIFMCVYNGIRKLCKNFLNNNDLTDNCTITFYIRKWNENDEMKYLTVGVIKW